ncbi:hypothetical protein MMC17_005638 [Xylographa soralifera]|nr:hypothetical protein [Xylographa soralifera]
MLSLQPTLHTLPILLLLSALCAATLIPNLPICLDYYGPVNNDDAVRAVHLLGAPVSMPNFPNPPDDIRFPHYYRFGSVLAGVDVLRMDPVAAVHSLSVHHPWSWHVPHFDAVRRTCVMYTGFASTRRERGGLIHTNGFYYVLVNAHQVGDLDACLRAPGAFLEYCVDYGVHRTLRGQQPNPHHLPSASDQALNPPPPSLLSDQEVQAIANSLLEFLPSAPDQAVQATANSPLGAPGPAATQGVQDPYTELLGVPRPLISAFDLEAGLFDHVGPLDPDLQGLIDSLPDPPPPGPSAQDLRRHQRPLLPSQPPLLGAALYNQQPHLPPAVLPPPPPLSDQEVRTMLDSLLGFLADGSIEREWLAKEGPTDRESAGGGGP